LIPFYWVRLVGGTMYLVGAFLLGYNVIKTISAAKASNVSLADPTFKAKPLGAPKPASAGHPRPWHHKLEGKPVTFSVLVLVAVIIGGPVQYIPLVAIDSNIPTISSVKPYTPLQLEGRDIYIREGCYNCHSQMVRPFRDEALRYGEYSKSGEFVYDYPFQWGSKRTGPDLHRIGGKYPDFWHYRHMLEPQSTTPGSIMPNYPWLYTDTLDTALLVKKMEAMQTLGVPYTDEEVANAHQALTKEADEVVSRLREQGVSEDPKLATKEIIALIAYLQRLGTDIKGGE
jgi:cytochrome c oxidase cbb3-type subunit I/II